MGSMELNEAIFTLFISATDVTVVSRSPLSNQHSRFLIPYQQLMD